MPTVQLIFGVRVVIYPNDHRPAHVHVIGDDCEALFNLRCPNGPPELRENYRFSRKVLSRIVEELTVNLAALCRRWSEIHGDY